MHLACSARGKGREVDGGFAEADHRHAFVAEALEIAHLVVAQDFAREPLAAGPVRLGTIPGVVAGRDDHEAEGFLADAIGGVHLEQPAVRGLGHRRDLVGQPQIEPEMRDRGGHVIAHLLGGGVDVA